MKAFSVGAGVLVALTGCSGANNQGDENPGPGTGSFPQYPGGFGGGGFGAQNNFPQGGSQQGGGGNINNPPPGGGQGGVVNPFPQGGGGTNPFPQGGGGTNPFPQGGGGTNPFPQGGSGGVIDPPPGGGGNPGGAGSGNVQLQSCTQDGETPAAPITQPCGDFKAAGTYATKLDLGPYGGQMDVNVGKGFENPDPNDSGSCGGFAALFGEDPKLTAQLLDIGPQPCNATAPNTGNCLDQKLYSVFRPAIWPAEKLPVLSWGNGTCAQPEGYGALLRYIASKGFFVVAANTRQTGNGTAIRHGLDFAAAANDDPSSPYYGHLDMSKAGVMGHSQGSSGAAIAVGDSRAQAVILFNGGTSSNKPFLAVSGDLDIGGTTEATMKSGVNGAAKGAYLYYHNPQGIGGIRGHLVLMLTPQRVTDPAANFWLMVLKGDAAARSAFTGITGTADFGFGQKGF
jgi:hypothetical protein